MRRRLLLPVLAVATALGSGVAIAQVLPGTSAPPALGGPVVVGQEPAGAVQPTSPPPHHPCRPSGADALARPDIPGRRVGAGTR